MQTVRHTTSKPMHLLAVNHVTYGAPLAPPRDRVAVVGFNSDRGLSLAMAHHVVAGQVVAERLKGGNDRRFAAVVWAHQNGQAVRRLHHSSGMRHEIFED